jgi:hypothetical protein
VGRDKVGAWRFWGWIRGGRLAGGGRAHSVRRCNLVIIIRDIGNYPLIGTKFGIRAGLPLKNFEKRTFWIFERKKDILLTPTKNVLFRVLLYFYKKGQISKKGLFKKDGWQPWIRVRISKRLLMKRFVRNTQNPPSVNLFFYKFLARRIDRISAISMIFDPESISPMVNSELTTTMVDSESTTMMADSQFTATMVNLPYFVLHRAVD